MGIYSDEIIHGISLILNDMILFKKIYNEKINLYEIEEVKTYYDKLTDQQKNAIIINFYYSYSTTYNLKTEPSTYMHWTPVSRNQFESLFNV